VLPLGWVGEHRVDVTEIDHRRSIAVAGEGRDQVRTIFVHRQLLGLEARGGEVLVEELDRRPLVPGRVDRVEADESLQDLDRLLLHRRSAYPPGGYSTLVLISRSVGCSDVADDLAIALELAELADEITLGRFRASDLVVETKPDMTPVTEADRAVEQAIRARLAADRTADEVVGEEFGESSGAGGGNGRRWIIDPIDGTKSYVRGIPTWATLLALEVDGVVNVGVVSAPALHRRWWARRGEGAWVDDHLPGAPRRLAVSAVRELAGAELSFAGLKDWDELGRLDALAELGRRCWRTRAFGDVWSYMLVAEGAADVGGLDLGVKVWDLAAPLVIVEEAGGRLTDLSGVARADGGSGLATNGLLHEAVLEIIGTAP